MTVFAFAIVTLFLAIAALGASLLRRSREDALNAHPAPVDLRAMGRLFDSSDYEFLARQLSPFVLLRLRILRAIAASEYLGRLRLHAQHAIVIAKRGSNTDALLEAATALRIEVAKVSLRVWLGLLFPHTPNLGAVPALAKTLSASAAAR